MVKKLNAVIAEKLKQYGFDHTAAWDCHGTWVVYHNVLEKIAVQEGIQFNPLIVHSGDQNNVAIEATGTMEIKDNEILIQSSIGEASPKNCKNAYPWAMAEKRAKDRVILKLIGLSGLVYSEEEAYDIKASGKGVWEKPQIVSTKASRKDYQPLGIISALLVQTNTDLDRFLKYMNVTCIDEIVDTNKAITMLKQKLDKNDNS